MRRPHPLRYEDVLQFGRIHVESNDIDPMYPVLRHLQAGMGPEAAVAHTLNYVAWYNIASAEAWREAVNPDAAFARMCPTGVERRNLRGGERMIRHLVDLHRLREKHGGYLAWLRSRMEGDPGEDWRNVQVTIQECYGNGPWAAYKIVEILYRNHNFDLVPTDVGTAGPRKALEKLTGRGVPNHALVPLSEELQERLAGDGLELDLAQLETVLCDVNSWHNNKYTAGRNDHDHMWRQIVSHPVLSQAGRARLFKARKATLRHELLKELEETLV